MNLFSEDRTAELRELFFESAAELLQSLNEVGLELEARRGDAEIVRRVRRIVHTLKGDSAACGFSELSKLAHQMEDALAPQAQLTTSNSLPELIFTAADTFQAMLAAYHKGLPPPSGSELREQIRRISRQLPLEKPEATPPRAFLPKFSWNKTQRGKIVKRVKAGDNVFNIALRLDPASGMRSAGFELVRKMLNNSGAILALRPATAAAAKNTEQIEAALATRETKEAIAAKCRIPSVVSELILEEARSPRKSASVQLPSAPVPEFKPQEIHPEDSESLVESAPPTEDDAGRRTARVSATLAAAENTLRVDSTRIDAVLNLVGELIIGKSMLHRTIHEFDRRFPRDPLRSRFADALSFQSRVLDELQRSVMNIRMVPVEQLFRRFPRIVRDISKQCNKEVALQISGENTGLDKSILDALAEPLAHLVRNSVDHGIESAAARLERGKSREGTIRLDSYYQGNQVVIEVSDDGCGIDREKLIQRAIERGIISSADAAKLSEADSARLIFEPGLTTADSVTQISGRGIGMDVVASALKRLKGSVDVESKAGVGAKIRLIVPLTLASVQALLFRVAQRLYAVPLANVVEIARITDAEIHRVDNYDVIRLREQLLTLVHLEGLDTHVVKSQSKKTFVIVIGMNDRQFGLVVDSLIGEEELVIKALDDRFAASDLVTGASILGDGTVVLILNIAAISSSLARNPALGAIA
ncbi:MAG TPA: chemotaxis protein CheA [Candidatus Acidoferrales bacterium]|nr:chemotaxis protein CheA [Candidatus Acidoferrales bacterium]